MAAIGSKWVLIAQTRDGGFFDGLVAVRRKEIVKVAKSSSFEGRFAQTQPDWPPSAPAEIDLDTTRGLIRDLSQISPLIGIEQERRFHTTMTWIGVVDKVGKGWLWLHETRPDASWHKRPLGYKLSRITKVAISDQYQTGLAAIAGTTPRP
ncbi:MAG TPA: hypothetical protein VFC19_47645 [Candidatus Limnocylindrales bacterium]|nr:hypothetical protein [Candidatus Limnocylindrales bacterium]